MSRPAALLLVLLGTAACAGHARPGAQRPPIIDMHLHAHALADYGGGVPMCTNARGVEFPGVDPRRPITFADVVTCPAPIPPAASDSALMAESIAMLERYNIVAVTTGPVARVNAWRAAARGRIIPATAFHADRTPSRDELRRLVAQDSVRVFAEVSPQYDGVRLDDERFDAYFALAEELDVPVGVHLGEGPPGGAHMLGGPGGPPSPYRARLTSPLQLEDVIVRHPRLRIYVMHYGSPLVDEMIALLYSHPQVYVDVAQNDWGFPRAHFYAQLKRLVDAGFGKRILFGTDQMIWPQAIPAAIETIERAPFLSARQKRDIFHDNAARFLRLPAGETARP